MFGSRNFLFAKSSAAAPINNYGQLFSWGRNNRGQLGLGNTTNYSSPKQVGSGAIWTKVAAAQEWSFGIKTDGTLWAWGRNFRGVLGTNNTYYYSSPVQVGTLTAWASVTVARSTALALKTDGTLWSWGYNSQGQLGIGDTTRRSSPVQIGALTNWAKLAKPSGGWISSAIKTNGTLWAWGMGYFGGQGRGNTTDYSSPVQVGSDTWSEIQPLGTGTLAIKSNGTLWASGGNGQGQLGLGNTTNISTFTQVGSSTDWSSLGGALYTGIAIKTDKTLWAWGNNGVGQFGNGTTTSTSSPVQVSALTVWSLISAQGSSTPVLAIKTNNTLWAWGDNSIGQLGLGNTTNYYSPVQVGALTKWANVSSAGTTGGVLGILAA